jgi:hypothetical protein
VTGLQESYRAGLAHLDQRARAAFGVDFASAPAPAQDAVLGDASDDQVQSLVGAALANTLEAMYGPPEYGGNRGLVGWTSNGWLGDRQPTGFTAAQVSNPDPASVRVAGTDRGPVGGEQLVAARWGRRAPRSAPWLGRRGLGAR